MILMLPFLLGFGEPRPGAWVNYWDLDNGMRAVRRAQGRLSDVMLFAVHLDASGNPRPAREGIDLAKAVSEIRDAGAVPWVTVVNDVADGAGGVELKDTAVVHTILTDPEERRRHRQSIVELAVSLGVDGVDLDYENLSSDLREPFTQFVGELAKDLEAGGLRLSVTVQPKSGSTRAAGPGAADWAALCRASDRLQIMLYNLHNRATLPGPVATNEWIDDVLDFALTRCEPERIVPVLKVGGFDWGPGDVRDMTFRRAETLLESGRVERQWDEKRAAPYLRYDSSGEERTAYYEDAESLELKLRAIKRHGLTRVMLWSLGQEDPAILAPDGQ